MTYEEHIGLLRTELLRSTALMNTAIRLMRTGGCDVGMLEEQAKRNMAVLNDGDPEDAPGSGDQATAAR